jgi:hypothetical protein
MKPKITFETKPELKGVIPEPRPANKFIPEWYKKMSSNISSLEENPNKIPYWNDPFNGPMSTLSLKGCVPVLDYLSLGYTIPLWQDLIIQKTAEGLFSFVWSDGEEPMLQSHLVSQVSGSWMEEKTTNGSILKLMCPWHFKTPKGYSCFFFSPHYHRLGLEILPAIVDTDEQHEVHFPFILHEDRDEPFSIPVNTPVIQVFPFKRQDWKMEIKTLDPVEHKRRTKRISSFIYRNFRHSKKKFT